MQFFDIDHIAFTILDYGVSYVELLGTFFGPVSVYLASRANILTWPAGIINEFFFFLLFFQVQLYADMFLQVYFFGTTLYGWYRWGSKGNDNRISFVTLRARWFIATIIISGTVAAGFLFSVIHIYLPVYFPKEASYPFADSFIMVTSIVATILLAMKKMENWLLWIAIDIVCVVLYFFKGIYFMSLEYFIFLMLASYGLYHWNKTLKG